MESSQSEAAESSVFCVLYITPKLSHLSHYFIRQKDAGMTFIPFKGRNGFLQLL